MRHTHVYVRLGALKKKDAREGQRVGAKTGGRENLCLCEHERGPRSK